MDNSEAVERLASVLEGIAEKLEDISSKIDGGGSAGSSVSNLAGSTTTGGASAVQAAAEKKAVAKGQGSSALAGMSSLSALSPISGVSGAVGLAKNVANRAIPMEAYMTRMFASLREPQESGIKGQEKALRDQQRTEAARQAAGQTFDRSRMMRELEQREAFQREKAKRKTETLYVSDYGRSGPDQAQNIMDAAGTAGDLLFSTGALGPLWQWAFGDSSKQRDRQRKLHENARRQGE